MQFISTFLILFAIADSKAFSEQSARSCEEFLSTDIEWGTYDVVLGRAGKSVMIQLSPTSILETKPLYQWGRENQRLAFVDWPFFSVMPVRSTFALLRELHHLEQYNFSDRHVFRRLAPSFLKKLVAKGRTLHVNLDPADEVFIREITRLDPKERRQTVKEWLRDFSRGIDKGEGAITRFELLTICMDRGLFSASVFYRNYKYILTKSEIEDLNLNR